MITSTTKSFDNNLHKLNTDAPNTFRTPISLMRCSAIKEAIPNSPRQLINIASIAKTAGKLTYTFLVAEFLCIFLIDEPVVRKVDRD